MPVNRKHLHIVLMALFCALPMWLLVSSQPAAANAYCRATPQTLNFGTSLTATGTVDFSCVNQNNLSDTFTLCLVVGTPTPGTASQPRLQYQDNFLDYNLYTNAARTQVWTTANFFTKIVAIPAGHGAIITGSFTYYAKIPAAQIVPVGTYTGQSINALLGFQEATGQPCNISMPPNFDGDNVTLNVSATVPASCALGTIGAIDFGSQPGLVRRADAAGSVQLTCPPSHVWTLSFDGGRYPDGDVRRMRSPAGDFVAYGLYRDAGRYDPIAIDGTITGTGTGAAQTTAVYGRVAPATPPPSGQYQDSVVVTLSF